MWFRFDERRATQAAAHLIRLAGGRENYTKLLKLLYLADRASLIAVGAPIAGARFCNMENGPLASDVYDCIKGELACPFWTEHIAKDDRYHVKVLDDPGDSELSDFDVDTLDNLFQEHRGRDFRAMIDFVHGLPEWHDPGKTSASLPPEQILKAAHIDDDTIAEFETRNQHVERVQQQLG